MSSFIENFLVISFHQKNEIEKANLRVLCLGRVCAVIRAKHFKHAVLRRGHFVRTLDASIDMDDGHFGLKLKRRAG